MDKKPFNEVMRKLINDYFEPYYHCCFYAVSDFTEYKDSDWGYITDFYYPNSYNEIDVTLTVSASENHYYLNLHGILYDQLPYNTSLDEMNEYFTNIEDYKSWLEDLKDEDLAEPGLYSEMEQKIFEEVLKYKDFEDFAHQFEAEESIDLEISEETYYAFLVELKDCLQNNWGDNQGGIDIRSLTQLIDAQLKELQEEEERLKAVKNLIKEFRRYQRFMNQLEFLGGDTDNIITDSDIKNMEECDCVEDIAQMWYGTSISYELYSDDELFSDNVHNTTITWHFDLAESGDAVLVTLGVEKDSDVVYSDVFVCCDYKAFLDVFEKFMNDTLPSVLGADAYNEYSGEIKKLKNTI